MYELQLLRSLYRVTKKMYNKTCARYFVAPFPAEKVHRTAVVLQSTTSVNINSEKRDVNDLFGTQTVDLRGG